MGKKLL